MRQPAVAGRFYPGSFNELSDSVEKLISPVEDTVDALAVVSPHAGYMFSGALAGKTLASVNIPETVVIIGPNHTGLGAPVSLSQEPWEMVFGPVEVDEIFSELLLGNSEMVEVDHLAHRTEHSLEVQIPFLQKLNKNVSIVPLVVSRLTYDQCTQLADALVHSIESDTRKILLLASTDMSHFETRKTSEQKDRLALKQIENLNPETLYQTIIHNRISMCGFIPVVICILAAQKMGAETAELVGYTDSGHVSGDTSQVVGYAGVIIR